MIFYKIEKSEHSQWNKLIWRGKPIMWTPYPISFKWAVKSIISHEKANYRRYRCKKIIEELAKDAPALSLAGMNFAAARKINPELNLPDGSNI